MRASKVTVMVYAENCLQCNKKIEGRTEPELLRNLENHKRFKHHNPQVKN